MNALQPFLSALLIVLAGSVLAVPSSTGAPLFERSPTLMKHLRAELEAKDPVRQGRALADIIALANCPGTCTVILRSAADKRIRIKNETGVGSVVDLDALLPDLLETYWRGPTDGHRRMALSALLHIGNERVLKRLIQNGREQSSAMERTMHQMLAAFYLERYPELTELTVRTQELSLEDVTRARALRVKREKN